jgi:hypothetical protein
MPTVRPPLVRKDGAVLSHGKLYKSTKTTSGIVKALKVPNSVIGEG